jgi:hypothetical protein
MEEKGSSTVDTNLLIDRTVGFRIKDVPYLFVKLDENGADDD